jgi:hypothetical protein
MNAFYLVIALLIFPILLFIGMRPFPVMFHIDDSKKPAHADMSQHT